MTVDKATLRQMLGTKRLTGSRNQCPSCGLLFNSQSGFDYHRVAATKGGFMPRRCLSPTELRERGWNINEDGFWVTPDRGDPSRPTKMPSKPSSRA